MLNQEMADHQLQQVLDQCEMYERRLVSAMVLRLSIERNGTLMRAFDPDSATVLRSFAAVIEAIESSRPKDKHYMEICAVADRIRDFTKFRSQPPPPNERPVLELVPPLKTL